MNHLTLNRTRSSGGSTFDLVRPTGTRNDNALLTGLDAVIETLSAESNEPHYLKFRPAASGGTRILDTLAKHYFSQSQVAVDGWRASVRKVAMLSRLQQGWDYPESKPLDRVAQANYLEWLTNVSGDRMEDAEPLLTDDGHIRLEWRKDGFTRIAEIGPDSLYLAVITPSRAGSDAIELDYYDESALSRFFTSGVLR